MRNTLRQLGIWFLLLFGVVGSIFVVAHQNSATSSNAPITDPLARWNAHALHSYRLRLDLTAVPLSNIEMELLIRADVIAEARFPACEETPDQYSTLRCEQAEAYYRAGRGYTVMQLFELAESCTDTMRQVSSTCGLPEVALSTGLSSFQALQATLATSCPVDSSPVRYLCAVGYDSIWGYPTSIESYLPGVDDGYGYIRVTAFEPLDS